MSTRIFVPPPDSQEVQKLLAALGTDRAAVIVRVVVTSHRASEGYCYQNVSEKVRRVGGRMQLGWAVWQHGNLFIEAEAHAVFDPGKSQPWIDPTPPRPAAALPAGQRWVDHEGIESWVPELELRKGSGQIGAGVGLPLACISKNEEPWSINTLSIMLADGLFSVLRCHRRKAKRNENDTSEEAEFRNNERVNG